MREIVRHFALDEIYNCLQYKIVCDYILFLIDTQLLESKIFRHESIQLFSLDSRTTHNFVESSRSFEENSGK